MPLYPNTRLVKSQSPRHQGLLKDHLVASEAFSRLTGQVERLQQLQSLLDHALPAHLLPGSRVANLKRGKVVIHVASGAVAVKLRQLAPRLTESFIQQGQELTGIEVRVQPARGYPPLPRKKSHKTLGARPKQSLTCLAAGLPADSPVRRAIERLLQANRNPL